MRRNALLSLVMGGVFILARCGGLIASSSSSLRRPSSLSRVTAKEHQLADEKKEAKNSKELRSTPPRLAQLGAQIHTLCGSELNSSPGLAQPAFLSMAARNATFFFWRIYPLNRGVIR
jgi:hypothetical protein